MGKEKTFIIRTAKSLTVNTKDVLKRNLNSLGISKKLVSGKEYLLMKVVRTPCLPKEKPNPLLHFAQFKYKTKAV